jgi:hypothetical protein
MFPADGHLVRITLRPGFGLGGAVWFEEPTDEHQRNWWVPLDLPGSLARVIGEVEMLMAEGAFPMAAANGC